MKQFDLFWADLNPNYGTEAGKTRPVVVIQTDLLNNTHPSTLICPLTTRIKPEAMILRIHLDAGESNLRQASDVMIDQIRAIDNRRIKEKIGELSEDKIRQLKIALQIVLDM